MSQSRGRARGAAILLYHVVGDLAVDPFKLAVAPDRFAAHMEIISTQFRPHTLSDLADGLAEGTLPPGSVAVTFDDGYANNLTHALPRLEQAAVPATVFVVTGYTGSEREFWWDELERLIMRGSSDSTRSYLEVTLGDERFSCDATEPDVALARLWGWLHRRGRAEIETAVEQVRRWTGVLESLPARETRRPMTVEELVRLGRSSLVELAPHTRSHPALDARSASVQRDELQSSRAELEGWLGRRALSFAYPYGNPARDYSRTTVEIVRDLGFRQAVATKYGLATASSSRLELPRLFVANLGADAFERWLHERFLPRGVRISRGITRRLQRSRG
jgi:peptidoglycan/xylan/chitin deacetylase (PgdA/CDA1 family)